MRTYGTRVGPQLAVVLLCLSALSCRSSRNVRTYHAPPPPDVAPTILHYVETDSFDEMFETVLISQDPVIIVQTQTSQPDWGPRLNAWIAAWNLGGKIVDEPRRRVRMQAPLPVSPSVVNGDGVRELRLLVADLMTRVEDLARRGSSWWVEERVQRRRVQLLKPYSLRFHLDENQKIQLVFFNGRYSRYYQQFMEAMSMNDAGQPEEWSRAVQCSYCTSQVPGTLAHRSRERQEP